MGRGKKANTLLDAFERCLKSGRFSRAGNEYVICCPFCDDTKGHHYVNVQKRVSYCFRNNCKISVSFRHQLTGHSVRNLLETKLVSGSSQITSQDAVDVNCPLFPIMELKGSSKNWALKSSVGHIYDYCISRGMTHKQIVKYRISAKPFENRVYFPYWNKRGDFIFWMGRALGKQEPKTVEKKGAVKPLFGRHANWVSDGPVVLVEGVFDHFATPMSYALMGSSITTSQIKCLIMDKVKKVFVIGDPDADTSAQSICKRLMSSYITAYPVQLVGTSKDPADLGIEKMSRVVGVLTTLPNMARPQQLRVNVAKL